MQILTSTTGLALGPGLRAGHQGETFLHGSISGGTITLTYKSQKSDMTVSPRTGNVRLTNKRFITIVKTGVRHETEDRTDFRWVLKNIVTIEHGSKQPVRHRHANKTPA